MLHPSTTPTMFLPISCTSPFTVASQTIFPPTLTGNLFRELRLGRLHHLCINSLPTSINQWTIETVLPFYHQPMELNVFFPHKTCGFMVYISILREVDHETTSAQVPSHQHDAVVLGLIRIFTSIKGLEATRNLEVF